ncbi:MAG: DUF4184 family protein [Candidatus Bathyarchaeota archaeon]|nr:DUF4184 family protein [Candidatus Bathyarchaeota archaeon]
MPLTPIHGLAVMFLYFKNKRSVDPLALFASATIIDLEPLYFTLLGEPFDHRIWHGYALALTVYPLLISLVVYLVERFLEKKLWSTYNVLRLKPAKVRYSLLTIYACCLIGGLSHIFFDMFTHEVMPYVVYPLVFGNPFFLGQASGIVELLVIVLALYSVYCWSRDWKP